MSHKTRDESRADHPANLNPSAERSRRKHHRMDLTVGPTARVNGRLTRKRKSNCTCGWHSVVWRPLADAVEEWRVHFVQVDE